MKILRDENSLSVFFVYKISIHMINSRFIIPCFHRKRKVTRCFNFCFVYLNVF